MFYHIIQFINVGNVNYYLDSMKSKLQNCMSVHKCLFSKYFSFKICTML